MTTKWSKLRAKRAKRTLGAQRLRVRKVSGILANSKVRVKLTWSSNRMVWIRQNLNYSRPEFLGHQFYLLRVNESGNNFAIELMAGGRTSSTI
jgi:hypothetical protein